MRELTIGVWIEDPLYRERLATYMVTHESRRIRLHQFSDPEGLKKEMEKGKRFPAIVLSSDTAEGEEACRQILEAAGETNLLFLGEDFPAGPEKAKQIQRLPRYPDMQLLIRSILESERKQAQKGAAEM